MYIWKDQLEAKQRNGNKGSAKWTEQEHYRNSCPFFARYTQTECL